jgi:hypothetical protein
MLSVGPGQSEVIEVTVPLAAGASWTSSFNTVIDLTGGVDAYVGVFADVFGEVTELNEWNNSRFNTVAWPAAPDLTVSSKYEEFGESTYIVHFTVTNMGNATAAPGYHVSLTVDDQVVESYTNTPALDPGESYSGVFSDEIDVSNGWDSVVVCVDTNQVIPESVEWNNCMTNTAAWPEAPDLQIGLLTGENWIDQNTYTVTGWVQNFGNAVAPAGFDVSLSINGVLTEVLPVQVNLPPGQTQLVFFTTRLNVHGSTDNITVCADSNQEVTESREDNNCYSVNLPSPPPDLVISEKHEEWVDEGVSYKVYFTVKNIGQGTARPGHSVVLFIDFNFLNPTETIVVPWELGPGESWSSSFDTVVMLTDNLDFVSVNADAFPGIIYESNELNNFRTNNICWEEKPDLTITDRYDEWVSNGIYKVYFTIRNDGIGTALAGHDAVLTVDGQFIGSQVVPVALGQSESYSNSFTSEIAVSGGWDTVMVCADANNEVDESNEFINCRIDTVAWPPQPDLEIVFKSEAWAGEGIYTVTALVRNNGNAVALPGHDVSLSVDGSLITTSEIMLPLQPGESLFWVFPGTQVTLSGGYDEITVCADANQEVNESREDNNCRTNFWPSEPTPVVAVSTLDATSITMTSAILHGYLDSLGESGTAAVSFVWGPESQTDPTNYPNETIATPSTLTETGAFSAMINTLEPDTQYFFRAAATDGVTVYGDEMSFTTLTNVGVHFSIQPSSQTVGVGQIFEVTIWVDASTQDADTVEAYVDFDTTYLKAVNAAGEIIVGTANNIITTGPITTTTLTTRLKNRVDNNNGYADIAYGMPPGGTPANTNFLFGTVRLKAMTETEGTTLSFHATGLRTTMASLSFADVTGNCIDGDVVIAPEVLLRISVSLQGRPAAPNDRWIIPVEVWLHAPGAPWTEDEGNGSLYYFETQTTNEGVIELLVEPGTYDIRVKGQTTLKNLVTNVEVYAGPVEVDLGTLVEGDVNGDNMVTGIDYSAVIMCFGYAVGDPGAPGPTPNCDFNNDGFVTGLDYSAIIMNFGLGGADIE